MDTPAHRRPGDRRPRPELDELADYYGIEPNPVGPSGTGEAQNRLIRSEELREAEHRTATGSVLAVSPLPAAAGPGPAAA